jgi:hypothetical protein
MLAGAAAASRSAEQWYEDTYETDQYDDQGGVDWGEYEWDPSSGLHREEWYDPSDWFDDDESVEYEDYGPLGTDEYGYYGGYGYDYDLYDSYPYWSYGGDYDYYDMYDDGYPYWEYGTDEDYEDMFDYDYGWDFDVGEDNYYTDDWYDTDDAFGDWYDAQ